MCVDISSSLFFVWGLYSRTLAYLRPHPNLSVAHSINCFIQTVNYVKYDEKNDQIRNSKFKAHQSLGLARQGHQASPHPCPWLSKTQPEALKSCVGRIEAAPYVLRPSKGCFVGAFSTSFTSILTDLWDLIERSNQKSNQPVVHEIKYSMFRRLTRDKERQQHHATPFIWSRASWFHMFLPMQLALQHLSDLCHPRKPMIQSCPS